jgi:hypothetical protein
VVLWWGGGLLRTIAPATKHLQQVLVKRDDRHVEHHSSDQPNVHCTDGSRFLVSIVVVGQEAMCVPPRALANSICFCRCANRDFCSSVVWSWHCGQLTPWR